MSGRINLHLEGDNCWPDLLALPPGHLINLMDDPTPIGVAVLPNGTHEGRPSVTLRIDLPDGRVVLTQTTARLWVTIARAIEARYGSMT